MTLSRFLLAASLAATSTTALVAQAQNPEPPSIDQVLGRHADSMTFEKASIPTIFYTIGRTYGINIQVDPSITGTSLLRFNGGTLRQLLMALLDNNDLFMEEKDGFLYIRRTKVAFYFIDYPRITRTSTSSTSISLSPSSNNVGSYSGIGGVGTLPQQTTQQYNANGQNGANDSTQFSISEKSDDSFWDGIEQDIKTQMQPGEKLVLNRFSGIATIDTTLRRHDYWKAYIDLLNHRINAQVLVELRIEEVTLNDQHKLGIDWTQIGTAIHNTDVIGPISSNTDITTIGSQALSANTLLGNFSVGKLSAVFTALKEQGDIKTVSKPYIRLLNNEQGFVKVGDDRTFYSLYSNVSINNNSLNGQIVTQSVYSGQRQTFGVVLPVTAQISQDGYVTLVLEPARTQLNGVDTSPDKTQTAPNTGDQSISTMLRLRDNESAVVGGLDTETTGKSSRGVPLLSSIPYLGALARTDATTKQTSELIIAVSVHIIK